MSKISRKPGLSIRRLARSRSIVSTVSFATAAFLVVVAPVIFVALGQSYVAIALAVVVFNAAVWLVCFGFLSRQKARRADQGAIGEERLGLALEPLVSEGWAIEYNLKLRWGDADVYLASPSGKHYVIDAKSHRGGIIFFDPSSEMLMRRYESEIETVTYDLARDSYGKPKDLLKCVKGQALELARNNRLRWVTPIICFTGDIELDATIPFLQPLQGVYVSRLGGILDLLNRLENGNILSTARHKPSITVPSPPTADNGWVNTLDSQKPEVLSKAQSIISSNIYCNLSTATPDGYPWGSPVFFAYDHEDYSIYWCSAIAARHSQNLHNNQGRAFIVVYDSSAPAGSGKGLYFTGTATEETEPERISRAFKLLIVRANLNLERSALDYLYSSPRRIYRFQADETWVSGDRVPAGNNQLVDTKILIQLSSLINFFDT